MASNRFSFLLASVEDIQGTIRALDAKVFGVLVVLLLPLTEFTDVMGAATAFLHSNVPWKVATAVLFFLLWIIAGVSAFLTVYPLDNPSARIEIDGDEPKGRFYGTGIFKMGLINSYSFFGIRYKEKFSEYHNRFSVPEDIWEKELLYEQMKLVFIRTKKMNRQKVTVLSSLLWVACGLLIWVTKTF